METFRVQKVSHYKKEEIVHLPEHTDYSLLSVVPQEQSLKLILEKSSTQSAKSGRADILLTDKDLLPLIVMLVNYYKQSMDDRKQKE
ncbi:hypothetical protein [Chitinophaga sp. YR573]|uniref:hypothetical protein n=1 Tax=Chitinophaga sp. YR573 TaxID=1881040 RepID=UPI00115FB2FE|nr:hypothetical protein [Chitinophaga sp. YR573]